MSCFDGNFLLTSSSVSLEEAGSRIEKALAPQQAPAPHDIRTIRSLCRAVSERSAIYIAIAVFTLWRLQRDSLPESDAHSMPATRDNSPIAVAYCGAVADNHPTIRARCQKVLDLLVEVEPAQATKRRLVLEAARESGLLGAAVGAVHHEASESSIANPKL